MLDRRQVLKLVAGSALAPTIAPLSAMAQEAFPNRTITIIVPFAPGQAGDLMARLVADQLGKMWNVPVIIDNKGGSGGTIGTKASIAAPNDGYTWLQGSSGPLSIAPNLYKNVGYDPRTDFTALMNVAGVAQVLTVSADSKYKTMQDLVAAAKASPGMLNYGSGGAGSTQHLTMELFKQRAGIDIVHVPYKGSGPAMADLYGGRIDALFDSQPGVMGAIQAGKARALAVSTTMRAPGLPDVPTVAEAYPGFDVLGWLGLVAPKGVSPTIAAKIETDLKKVIALDEVKARFASLGMIVVGTTGAAFQTYIDSETTKWGDVIRAGKISVE
ncbi:tripartite tricarboxylate transporter substrate binding protein [Aquabacter sp. CN5-332]|uniref:Bug family tripartite tricarboxylate transporter substrate binding protein n=1 Tax=Aquabacter sp. CN5-332 TaxID=3156608 RepID=UPI0032B602AC